MRGAVPQFDAGQGAELVDMIGHGTQIAYVAFVPDSRRQTMRVVGFRVDGAVLGIDPRPTALGLDRAVRRLKAGLVRARTDAMGHLIESVAQSLRSDLDRLKQDVVFWIARHTLKSSVAVSLCASFIARGRAPQRLRRL